MRISGPVGRPEGIEDLMSPALMARLDRLDLRTRRAFPGKMIGERRSKRRGQSVEFDDYRQYVPGDDPRFLDWNVYARMEKLFIKLFLEDEDLALHLVVDASASMHAGSGAQNKLLYAARVAMALGYVGLVKQNRVTVSVFGRPGQERLSRMPDCRGKHHTRRLSEFLLDELFGGAGEQAAQGVGGGSGFEDSMTRIARGRVGQGVMVILSDFLDPQGYEGGLKVLAASGGYDTLCLQLLTPSEIDPSKDGDAVSGDVRLTDAETGLGAEVTITPALLKVYRARVQGYISDLRAYCLARGMAYELVETSQDATALVTDRLRRIGLLA